MNLDVHIAGMLTLLQTDPDKRDTAFKLLRTYRARGLAIVAMGYSADHRQRELAASREQLRTDLCDLVEPMLSAEFHALMKSSTQAAEAQQNKPGA